MKGLDLLEVKVWKPLESFGFTNKHFELNAQTIITTWLVLFFLLVLLLPARWLLKKKSGMGRFIVTEFVTFFVDFSRQALGLFNFSYFSFISTLFIFIMFCNIIAIIPWLEEPTTDLNTTLAFGIISFFYVQIEGIKKHGLLGYLQEYVTPFFLMFPLHVVGKIASIVSLSFRLFGNIFGGSIITKICLHAIQGSWLFETAALVTGFNFALLLFFGLFEGFLQAFVFTMLTLTNLSIVLQGTHIEEEAGEKT